MIALLILIGVPVAFALLALCLGELLVVATQALFVDAKCYDDPERWESAGLAEEKLKGEAFRATIDWSSGNGCNSSKQAAVAWRAAHHWGRTAPKETKGEGHDN